MSRAGVEGLKRRMYEQHLKSTGVMPKRGDLRRIEDKAARVATRSENKKRGR